MTNKYPVPRCADCGRHIEVGKGTKSFSSWKHSRPCLLDQRASAEAIATQFLTLVGDIERATDSEELKRAVDALFGYAKQASRTLRENQR